ncbi:MarR family transcriptional regulator [Flexivirga endophytica]|uniref:MarR family transcriptional regulator n=1 Tax=Flexivirga endophytica TaxID=1849103 RepID=A0A916T0Y4_9MICO|nr:MarR family winged helix-turn-helix transcriptional regulator [Flexivirga endophytica]GGB23493.1 MarR family transcriptional regulator [Flexivirga endophytica]GHB57431.1 MarR family transcriptional regulator [Flexivirga endophytica]
MSRAQDADRELAEQLRTAIGRLVRATRAQTDTLPRARAELLGQLDRDGPRTIAQLAAGRNVRHQAISRAVKDVEALGLVERRPDPNDARAQLIRITAAGAIVLTRDRAARRDLLATAIGERLDDAERRALQQVPRLLAKLSAAD